MSHQSLGGLVRHDVPCLDASMPIREAIGRIVEADLPALPVVDGDRYVGLFGEREFIAALFPGYVAELGGAGFIPRAVEDVIDKRLGCAVEPIGKHVTTDHVDVDSDFSDVQLAEIFLHHRVSIIPVIDGGRVTGVISRGDFFEALAQRFAERS